ncbi:tyrosine-protein phosphatase [Garciella nitratireducens]|uniref:tyrosine-protein phosphatase n=1 Tax=Garciella nitratireducens TaxID=218205 RepID=UPI000DE858CF|nr:CpsB/CapC family capsule biosynthesis tyrosine phosphatase [Garciella nitratireducens]RBP42230.1 protein-tyrosine phosphatase [Garciella nitratireducens]
MWDFHSHILPFLDDGAEDFQESIAMAKIAKEEGIHTIIATPHYVAIEQELSKEEIIQSIEKVSAFLEKEQLPLKILPGMEVFGEWEILKKIDQGEILSLNDSRYLLMELPMHQIPEDAEDLFYELQIRELIPVVAHPERYIEIQENPNLLIDWMERGVLLQINTTSLTGVLGQAVQETAKLLVQHNMVHLLGTDAHTSRRRSPKMKEAVQLLNQWLDPSRVQLLLEEYPQKILANEPIQPIEPIEIRKKKKRKFPFFFH